MGKCGQKKGFIMGQEHKIKIRESMLGNKSAWKGGRIINPDGYILIRNLEQNKYLYEHRLIMEKSMGRKLDSSEFVHHINGIKTDNRIENLMIVTSQKHYGSVRCPHCLKNFYIK